MSDSLPLYGLQPTRLLCPWNSPGKNTGVGCHFLLQCRKVKSESEVAQSYPTLSDPMDCSPPGSSVHGIFQARVLEWGAIAFSVRVRGQIQFQLFSYGKNEWPRKTASEGIFSEVPLKLVLMYLDHFDLQRRQREQCFRLIGTSSNMNAYL